MQTERSLAERLSVLPPQKRAALEALLHGGVRHDSDLRPRGAGEPVPLAYGQQRLWVLDQLDPGNPAYNETNSLRFSYALHLDVFRRAVNEIVRRHESLRMRVEVIDGQPFQHFASSLWLPIPLNDLRHLPPSEREAEALRLAAEQSRSPMDLTEGPLLHGAIFRLDVNDYLFVLTMHHMLCDGWSMGVFMVELLTLYWSFMAGKRSPLPELEIQYGDYAVWQHRRFSGEARARQLAYWREQLRDLPTLNLPADRRRPAEFSFRGARCPVRISGSEFTSLSALAKQHSVTLFIVMLAVYVVLLHRYTEQDDIVIGTPTSARIRKDLEPLIGLFVNTVVTRVKVDGNPTFLEVIERVRDTVLAGSANHDVPFEAVVEDLQPVRDKSRNPLFQVMFQLFQAFSVTGFDQSVLIPFAPVNSGIAKFDLSLELFWVEEEEVYGHFEYNTDLFDGNRISRMAGHLHRVLQGVVADPSRRISEVAILTPEEDRQLVEWNRTSVPYPRNETVPRVFRKQVERTPDAVAIRFEGQILSYRELEKRADRMAIRLVAEGIRAGDHVGLYLDRSLEFPSAVLGILQVGAAYVPLDPEYPKERIAYLLSDSKARAVVTSSARARELRGFSGPVIAVDAGGETTPGTPDAPAPRAAGSPTDIAYVIYTSGTTGQPKGVAVTHRNILCLVKNVRYLNYDSEQTVLQFAPISFDASTFEIWACLLNGGILAVHPPGVPSLEELGEFIRTEQVSMLFLTTSLFRQMIERCAADLRGVKQVVTGGEAMFPPLAKAAWEALPRSRVVNAYGPTECTTFATTYCLGSPESLGDAVPIGKPIDNTTMHVLDRFGNPMPVGVVAELYIGGDGVADGYWRRPDITKERFLPNPFTPGGRLYRTGDFACFREDGNLLFVGRRDRQVKVSGYRIELGEVEAAVVSHPHVKAAAVVVSTTVEKRLTAFCELHAGKTLSLAELREHVMHWLPHYMVPSHLELMDQLPLTANGKVDVQALDRLALDPAPVNAGFVAPRNRTEQVLSDIWSEMLQVERVGVTDNFFELGGHSLVATRLLSRVRASFDTQITMREFFDGPTIESLGQLLVQRAASRRDLTGQVT